MDDILILKNFNDKIIYSNAPKSCQDCISDCEKISEKLFCKVLQENRRRGVASSDEGFIYFCSNDQDLLNSSRTFKSQMDGLSKSLKSNNEIYENINREKNQDVRRLIHNLTSLNAHTIQELYNLVPQEKITDDWRTQINLIEAYILKKPTESAKAFLRVVKNVMAMKTEFSVFKILLDENYGIKLKSHSIRKVILNVYHTFFQDFKDKDIDFRISNSETYLLIDYESFRVAIYHLFQNAIKYCLKGSILSVFFREQKDDFQIVFEMVSLKILEDEREDIFNEGYSGFYAKKANLDGDGIGLKTSRHLLELNNAKLMVQGPLNDNEIESDGLFYTKKRFIVQIEKEFDKG